MLQGYVSSYFPLTRSVEGFSALRVFALTGGNRFLMLVVLMLSLAPPITGFVLYSLLCTMIHGD